MYVCLGKWVKNEELNEQETEDIKEFYKDLCDKAKAIAAKGKSCAISFVIYKKWIRDYIKE